MIWIPLRPYRCKAPYLIPFRESCVRNEHLLLIILTSILFAIV
jgi:hypothetical protein